MPVFKLTSQLALACLITLCVHNATVFAQSAAQKEQPAAFSFAAVQYFHRFTQADQHEFTPAGQEDLQAWTDMITLRTYRNAKDAEALAATANTVLGNYQANKAVVVKTSSVPRTKQKPAEHLIVVLFPRPKFIEAVFARFRMQSGIGTAVIYSHRIYGEKAGNAMSAWLEKNGVATETNLMQWDATVKLPATK
ncbi:MAG TPA: hypothetical protein VFZ34_11025 [Blastocatellia bacterium]|nr:hypothetical protein [Blastocatellia bacterium]